MARQVRDLLLHHLAGLGCSEAVDDAVLDYACGVLQSMIEDDGSEEDEDNLTHLDDLLAGALGERYTLQQELERQHQLSAIVQQARCAATAASSPGTQTAKDFGASPSQQRTTPSCTGLSVAACSEIIPPVIGQAVPRLAPSVVQELQVLCSGALSEGFLQYALECKFHMNPEALASWLLDSDSTELQSAEAQWEEQRQRELQEEEATRLLKVRNKQHVLQKFDLRPVTEPKDSKRGGKPLEMWVGKQTQQPSKVRYLEGRVVTTKGEKFIIEKPGEDWDGGSRGKVYTKGKRGKGYV